jgi:hypothetical protein
MSIEPSVELIERHLHLAQGLDGLPLISLDEARFRAQAIHEERKTVGFPLKLKPWTSSSPRGPVPYPAYDIDDPRYDLNKVGPGEKAPFGINGPGISCGDLVKLGRFCMLLRQHLPGGWPRDLKTQFLDVQSHLDAVEEVYSLCRWHGVSEVRMKMSLWDRKAKDVDLGFKACLVPLFVEVKNRRREAVGVVDGWHDSRNHPSLFNDLIGKFPESRRDGALHVAWISTHLEPDEALTAQTTAFLAAHAEIDAIVVWSDHSRDGRPFRAIYGSAATRKQLEVVLREPDREEAERYLVLRYLGRNSEEGRTLMPGEIAEWIRRQR